MNMSTLGNDAGVSSVTVRQWLSALEASFLIFELPPYFENFSKRVIKSPKYYFSDTGLLCYLLGIETTAQLKRDPLFGAVVENWVVLEALKARWHAGNESNLYFFRDSNGNEVDLILRHGHELTPIEIKASETFTRSFVKGLDYFASLAQGRVRESWVIYRGQDMASYRGHRIANLRAMASATY